jgi:fumarate reductase subunit C
MNVRLYLWQRLTAAALVPLLLIHVAVIFYATRQGLTAADILARTRGSVAWGVYYTAFTAVIAVHASIGLRNILVQWTGLRDHGAMIASGLFGLVLLALGSRAVAAVVLP